MAFRSASAVVGIFAASGVCSKPAGTASGDLLLAIVNSDGLNGAASTGWTSIVVQNITAPDGENFQVLSKTAGGSEPASYTFTNVSLGSIVILAFSGYTGAALTIGTAGVSIASNSSVISCATPGITVPSSCDLFYGAGLDQNTDETWSSAAPAGFTTRVQGKPAGEFSAICAGTIDSASSGATGTKTGTFTVDAGPGGQAGWGSVLIAIPVSGSPPPPPPPPAALMMLGVG